MEFDEYISQHLSGLFFWCEADDIRRNLEVIRTIIPNKLKKPIKRGEIIRAIETAGVVNQNHMGLDWRIQNRLQFGTHRGIGHIAYF